MLGLGAALDYQQQIGTMRISKRSYELKSYFRNKIKNNPKLKVKTPAHDELSSAIQVVEVVGKDVKDVQQKLLDEYNFDCRPMTEFGLNALRFSLAIYITKTDIDELVELLDTVAF